MQSISRLCYYLENEISASSAAQTPCHAQNVAVCVAEY